MPHRQFVISPAPEQDVADELVTVIVPAYNAQATIDETLSSIRGQTHRNLEILVVDDGSTDGTRDAIVRHALDDSRVRLIEQKNAGVAAARNTAIAQAKGAFIAPVDADDVWRMDKVALQLAAFAQGGQGVGLVYTWSALIDEDDHIVFAAPSAGVLDDLVMALARQNLVGNGSAIMVRKAIAQAIGGYDPTLRARGAQGCEDWKFYFQAAERCDFAVVPQYLTGYRQLRGNMSSDVLQMLRSRDLCAEEFALRHPQLRGKFHQARNGTMRLLLYRLLRERRTQGLGPLMSAMVRHDGIYTMRTLATLPVKALNPMLRRARSKGDGQAASYDWRKTDS